MSRSESYSKFCLYGIIYILLWIRRCLSDSFELQDSFWSRNSWEFSPYSQRTSHIGPAPHINEFMTEWAKWGSWKQCSRTCGGGVRSRTRTCITKYPRVMPGSGIRTSHDRCTGENIQYEVCGTQQCPAGQVSSISFRAAQCRYHNNKKVLGRVINSWVPYTQGGINPCALVCEGEGEGIVYTFGKVIDGTYCKTEKGTQGLCVNGRCLRLSCDGRLGGAAFEDMCRVCGGRNETCTRHSGIFHSERPSADQPSPGGDASLAKQTKSFGYYEVAQIPSGSTNVKVLDNSSNFLALKSGDKYLLNGDWLIDWPGEIDAAGASFSYNRKEDQSEALSSLGPTNSDLSLMVLLREENPGIYYEYWIPNNKMEEKYNINIVPYSANKDEAKSLLESSVFSSKYDSYVTTATPKKKPTNLSKISLFSLEPNTTNRPKLKPAVLTGTSLNKTIFHSSEIQDKIREGNVKNAKVDKIPDPLMLISRSEVDGNAIDKIFNLKNSSPSKYNPLNSNSIYQILDSTENKIEKDYKKINEKQSKKEMIYEKKKKKKKKRKRKRRPPYCKPCLEKSKAKHSFCTSDFVSRVQILNLKTIGKYRRLDVLILQSYKNKVPLLHKEFLWQDLCSCRRLREGKSYIVMGMTETSRGNEVKLVLKENSFVRRFPSKVLDKVLKFRQDEMKYCRKWRKSHNGRYSFKSYVDRYLHKRSRHE